MTTNLNKGGAATPAAAPKLSPAQEALAFSLARQSTGYHFGPQEAEGYDKNTNIVIAKNGIFRVVKTAIAIFTTKIGDMTQGYVVPGLPEMKEGVELLIPKIPFKYWLMPLSWYKDVNAKDRSEASVLFFWNHNNEEIPTQYNDNTDVHGVTEDGQLVMYCPKQKNSGGLSEFHNDGMVKWLREKTTPLLETHSHNTMKAYFSGTDDANENFYQFYAVYGEVDKDQPMFAFRFCSGKHKVEISPWHLFEAPAFQVAAKLIVDGVEYECAAPTAYNGPWPKIDYPTDWMAQHTLTGRTAGGYNGGGYKPMSSLPEHQWASGKIYDHIIPGWVWPDQKKTGSIAGAGNQNAGQRSSGSTGRDTEKNLSRRDVVETETSRVEINSDPIVSKFTRDHIINLVQFLCEAGYDRFIYEGIKEEEELRK
jgi:hypothetical protein